MEPQFIVPIILIAIFILRMLLRGGEEKANGPANRPRTPQDVERFLEEANRRRQLAEQQRRREGVPRAEPVRPRPTPRVESRPRQKESAIPAVIPVAQRPTPALELLPEVLPVAAPAAPKVHRFRAEQQLSPALAQVVSLLRSPQNLGMAMLLHEILGPPRCLKVHGQGHR